MEINEENCKPFGNRRKVMKLWIITLQIKLKKQNKQKNKQNNLPTLTVSCEKWGCLIRSKTKNKTKIIIVIITITIITITIKRRKRKKSVLKN